VNHGINRFDLISEYSKHLQVLAKDERVHWFEFAIPQAEVFYIFRLKQGPGVVQISPIHCNRFIIYLFLAVGVPVCFIVLLIQ
jgi:hypothetical protein